MNIAETTEPKSDQQQFDDFIGGITRTVTVAGVSKGTPEQPINVELEEYPGRPFRPSKSMRRVLIACWGPDSNLYVGRQITLFGDATVKFGGSLVGGVRIAALSHLDKPVTIALTVSRGKRAPFTVQPLTPPAPAKDTSGRDWVKELSETNEDLAAIGVLGKAAAAAHASVAVISVIRAEFDRVKGLGA